MHLLHPFSTRSAVDPDDTIADARSRILSSFADAGSAAAFFQLGVSRRCCDNLYTTTQ